jgi:hypothetical protein
MTIFFLLNGLGVVFLVYVLANFWKEGHRPNSQVGEFAPEVGHRDSSKVLVVTHPLSHSAQGAVSVIPFQSRRWEIRGSSSAEAVSRGTVDAQVRRISTR